MTRASSMRVINHARHAPAFRAEEDPLAFRRTVDDVVLRAQVLNVRRKNLAARGGPRVYNRSRTAKMKIPARVRRSRETLS
jgi:hypothetical protein